VISAPSIQIIINIIIIAISSSIITLIIIILFSPQAALPMSITAHNDWLRENIADSLYSSRLKVEVEILRPRHPQVVPEVEQYGVVGVVWLVRKQEECHGDGEGEAVAPGHQHPALGGGGSKIKFIICAIITKHKIIIIIIIIAICSSIIKIIIIIIIIIMFLPVERVSVLRAQKFRHRRDR
jgi:hypothetical protein